jgi:hypothetical protein
MTDFDAVAEQFDSVDGNPLVDYLPIGLPIYLLRVEALVAEKRSLMPVEEFVLRAIWPGNRSEEGVIGMLGIGPDYGEKVLRSLDDDEYIARRPTVCLRPKGLAALKDASERRIYERVLPFAWDPLNQRAIGAKLQLEKGPVLRLERVVRVVPPSTRLPPLADLPLEHPQLGQHDREQVIRYLAVQRRTPLYLPAVLLMYSRGRGNDPLVRVAVDGVIDMLSSVSFSRQELLLRAGVDSQFHRRLGSTAVEQRVKQLNLLPGMESIQDLMVQKSVLQLGIVSLEKRSSPEATAKLATKKEDLARVLEKLAAVPVRSLRPFEMPQMVDQALQKARHEVLVTTTLPIEARLTPMRLLLLEQALKRDVQVDILIADRLNADELSKDDAGPGRLVRVLSELMQLHANLGVSFLKDIERVVFEVKVDDAMLAVANEPPLGMRNREPLARVFSGYVLSGSKSVQAYALAHLQAQSLSVLERVKLPAVPDKKRGAKSAGGRAPAKRTKS